MVVLCHVMNYSHRWKTEAIRFAHAKLILNQINVSPMSEYLRDVKQAAERLRGTDGGKALSAVLSACEQLSSHTGVLVRCPR